MFVIRSALTRALLGALLLASPVRAALATASESGIIWLKSETDAFERARSEQRFVLLYLEAVWCHWCHVMDQRTYTDPAVVSSIAEHFVPLRIDQDARPDLANRYRDYGWPATIVFDAAGREVVKRQGFIAPEPMRRLLRAIVEDPSPEALAQVAFVAMPAASGLSADLRAELLQRHRATHDVEHGGLSSAQKYLDRDSVEYALTQAVRGDAIQRQRALQTLDAARALLDPVWGGVYQYSTQGDWEHPHFEKLATGQGEHLRVYALAHALTGEARYLEVAKSIRGYIEAFLADPAGGYYASQDADLRPGEHSAGYFALDDAARRRLGLPRVDTHRYTHQSATIAEAYAVLFEINADVTALHAAQRTLRWMIAERALPGGGYRHDARDNNGPFLADSLAAGRALLQLYRVTGERDWLARAAAAGDFIDTSFRLPSGYAGGVVGAGPIAPVAQIDENIALARFANLLSRYTGSDRHRAIATHALAHLARRDVALSRLTEAGILLADDEIGSDPLHLTVIGAKTDREAAALFAACLRLPAAYKRLDWWDRSEGDLPNPDVKYPPAKRAAAFVCTQRRCSLPIREPGLIAEFLSEEADPASPLERGSEHRQ